MAPRFVARLLRLTWEDAAAGRSRPPDFIVAKLRRGRDLDLDDAALVAGRFKITEDEVRAAAEAAIAASPKDTALFFFRTTVDVFLAGLAK